MFFLVSCRERWYRITLTSFWFNGEEMESKFRTNGCSWRMEFRHHTSTSRSLLTPNAVTRTNWQHSYPCLFLTSGNRTVSSILIKWFLKDACWLTTILRRLLGKKIFDFIVLWVLSVTNCLNYQQSFVCWRNLKTIDMFLHPLRTYSRIYPQPWLRT